MTVATTMPPNVSAKAKPHVLIIPSEQFLPPGDHLAGIFQLHQARALTEAGFQVGVISISQVLSILMIVRAGLYRLAGRKPGNVLDGRPISELASILGRKLMRPRAFIVHNRVDDIPVVRAEGFYFFPPSPSTDHIGWIRAGVAAFDEYCEKFGKPDVIHAHNLNSAGLLAHRISNRSGVPFVVTEHSTFFGRGLVPRNLFGKLRRAANAAKAVAVVSPALGDTLVNQLHLNGRNIQWIPNVIDPAVASTERSPCPRSGNHFDFLCIGNLIGVKNHAALLEAFQGAFSGDPRTRLRIGGDGPLESDLKQLAANLGIGSQVDFLGRLSRDAVIHELDCCDAFVLPSSYETFGVVLIEALVRGKPVVATRCGGPEFFVDESDGLLVRADDVAELSNALEVMRQTSRDYNPVTLRDNALARFGPEKLVENLRRFYDKSVPAHA